MIKGLLKIRSHRRFLARHRFMLYLEAGLFWALCVAGLFYATSFLIIPSIAESQLQKRCGGVVNIESGRFAGLGGLRLKGLVIFADTETPSDVPILQADNVDIQFNPWALMVGRWRMRSVNLSDILLTADFHTRIRRWNLSNLSFRTGSSENLKRLPEITLKHAVLRFRKITPDSTQILTTVGLEGMVTKKTTRHEYDFILQTDGRFGYGASQLQGGFQIAAKQRQNRFWATGNILFPESGVLQNRWDVQNISFDGTWDENTVTINESIFTMGTGTGRMTGQIIPSRDWLMDINVSLRDFQLSEYAAADTFVYSRLYDFLGSGANQFFQRYHPAGIGSIGSDRKMFNIKASLRHLSKAECYGIIYCDDISVTDRHFPYTLEHLTGEIEIKGKALELKHLKALHNDVDLIVSGTVEKNDPHSVIDFKVTSHNMQLDEDLFRALPDSAKQVWYEFSPTGRIEVDHRFQQSADGAKRMDLTLNLKGINALYKHFRYPLKNLTGQIDIDPKHLRLNELTAAYPDGRRITIDGLISNMDQPVPDMQIDVSAHQIPVDSNLIMILPQAQQAFFENLQIDAVADANIIATQDPVNRQYLSITADMDVIADTLLYKPLPLPMKDVTIKASMTPEVFRLDTLKGQAPGGVISLEAGQLYPQGRDPNHPGYRVGLEMENYELTPEFWQAAITDPNRIPAGFEILGPVDVNGFLEVNLPIQQAGGTDLAIHCNNNVLIVSGNETARIQGSVRLQDQTIELRDFNLNDVVLEFVPVELMTGRTKLLYESIRPRGRANIQFEQGRIVYDQDRITQADLNAEVDLRDVSSYGDAIKQLNGSCRGQVIIDSDLNRLHTQAIYKIESLLYSNLLTKNLSGSLTYDPNQMQFKSEDLQADLYDGRINGTCRINLNPLAGTGYELDLKYDQVDVPQLLAAARQETSDLPGRGKASGSLGLGGTFDNITAFQGGLTATVQDVQIGRQSLLGKILTAVQLKRPENFAFSQIELRADIQYPELVFNRIRMIGQPFVFEGTGRMDLFARQIKMQLAAWDRVASDRQTILDTLARGMGSALWHVEVDGSLDDPNVKAVYLSLLKQPLDVFKKDE